MRYLTILAALISFGCAGPQITYHLDHKYSQTHKREVPVVIDKNFPLEERHQLEGAIVDWNVALNGQMVLNLISSDFDMEEKTISYIYHDDGVMLFSVPKVGSVTYSLDDNVIAITDRPSHVIYFIKEKATIERIRNVALHELGHFLGAKHTKVGLMQPEYNKLSYSCIDYSTISQVAQFNYLNVDSMNWCEIK